MIALFKPAFKLLTQTVSEWIDDKAPRLGAALAFYTVFSMAPLIIIVLAIAGLWFDTAIAQTHVLGQLASLVGDKGANAIAEVINAANKPHEGILASAIAIVTLIFGATGAFVELQDALNTIWEVQPKAGLGVWDAIRSRLLSLAMIVAIGFLLLVSLLVSAALSAAGAWLERVMPGGAELWWIMNIVLSFGIISALFALMFKYLPDVEIEWKHVWIGGLITAALFTIGKYALGMYLGRSSMASAYGAAGSFAIFLLWVYYSAQIFFFGAEFTQVYANRFGKKLKPSDNAVRVTKQKATTAIGADARDY